MLLDSLCNVGSLLEAIEPAQEDLEKTKSRKFTVMIKVQVSDCKAEMMNSWHD